MLHRSHKKSSVFAAFSLMALLLAAQGCYLDLDVDDPFYVPVTDLRVHWTVEGSDAPALCGVFGVDRWQVHLTGPERRTVEVDCVQHYWSSENDLLALPTGVYTVELSGLDADGRDRAFRRLKVHLTAPDELREIDVTFSPKDFK